MASQGALRQRYRAFGSSEDGLVRNKKSQVSVKLRVEDGGAAGATVDYTPVCSEM